MPVVPGQVPVLRMAQRGCLHPTMQWRPLNRPSAHTATQLPQKQVGHGRCSPSAWPCGMTEHKRTKNHKSQRGTGAIPSLVTLLSNAQTLLYTLHHGFCFPKAVNDPEKGFFYPPR